MATIPSYPPTPIRFRQALQPWLLVLLAGFFWPSLSSAQTEPLRISIPALENTYLEPDRYYPKLLDLALQKTQASHGPYRIQYASQTLTTGRILANLKQGKEFDLAWALPDAKHEAQLIRIPISLLRGLSSHRVFLIRAEDQHRFEGIQSLEDLRQLRAGQGQHWVDTQFLRANKLPVVTSAHYKLLFNMLAGGRFDYFPRGLYEIQDELRRHQDLGLAIEPNLMLYYPAPMYFYVNKKDKALADRIEQGLRIAQEDGSFDKLFFSIPGFRWGYRQMMNPERQILYLKRPPGYPD